MTTYFAAGKTLQCGIGNDLIVGQVFSGNDAVGIFDVHAQGIDSGLFRGKVSGGTFGFALNADFLDAGAEFVVLKFLIIVVVPLYV